MAEDGQEKLCQAIINNNYALVRFLIEVKECSPIGPSKLGTPVNVACAHGRIRILNYLLDLIAHNSLNINQVDLEHTSCLHLVCLSMEKLWLIPRLLEHGADPNVTDRQGRSPLMICAARGLTLGVKILTKPADTNLQLEDDQGQTALEIARKAGHPETAQVLDEQIKKAEFQEREIPTEPAKFNEQSIKDLPTLSASLSMMDIDSKIAEELECPVCLEDMHPPVLIFSCSNAHLFCGRCNILELKTCPKCREDFSQYPPNRNRLAERWAHKLFS
ncbi:hypothetical protein TCAL_02464 [Tigriopus californicus]|uniref:RING-type domain-containing protein n=1 Tax=Tigriopus californicus TaxID=6832 RepID=A0A553NVB3_TIGCA|nr:homeobox protein Wariai-like [Tigriopus californicus]TRY69362.1 hypothetical protein TCAL_02464 [Tigriopus californicus]|eukprot:TCALIF_02464-PA protein Name:"Similar to KANK1 KN motif and ankyrin repeat domain-containing protein 1 (Homo sapiens)" AED:0.02 eAED:0.02 QI:0/1/0.5/1/1/1/2/87/274